MAGGILNMGRVKEPASVDLIETGKESEYLASRIAKFDNLANGWIRLYIAAHRSAGVDRLEFTVLVAPDDLAQMARECLDIAADAHNIAMFKSIPKAPAN